MFFLFAHTWMPWYGGLGTAIFTLVLIIKQGLVAKGETVTKAEVENVKKV